MSNQSGHSGLYRVPSSSTTMPFAGTALVKPDFTPVICDAFGTTRSVTAAPEQLWRIDQLTDGAYRLMDTSDYNVNPYHFAFGPKNRRPTCFSGYHHRRGAA